jgi:hypothetical protein
LQRGEYDIDSGDAERPTRIAVFDGSARFVGGGFLQRGVRELSVPACSGK